MDRNYCLAMTAVEYEGSEVLPASAAWMACHFSATTDGLSNLPRQLRPGDFVMLDDSFPCNGHDPHRIVRQLQQLLEQQETGGIILDLQRPCQAENARIAEVLVSKLSCPVCVSALYAESLDCPVLLPPPGLHQHLEEHLAHWQGRPIWLEATLESEEITVTRDGSTVRSIPYYPLSQGVFEEDSLFCRYAIRVEENCAVFTLSRDGEMLKKMLSEAERLGVQQAVGLYQQISI